MNKNQCTIVLTSGPNKGNRCCDVLKRCRHKNIVCECGEEFTHETSYIRHKKVCSLRDDAEEDRQKITVIKKSNDMCAYDILACKQKNTHQNNNGTFISGDHNNNTTINITNVYADDYYERLLEKFGDEQSAVNFIASVARKGSFYDLFGKLFIDGVMRDNLPCVSLDKKDLLYKLNNIVVRDVGAIHLSHKLYNCATNAILKSANILINSCLKNSSVDSLYNYYDIGAIQTNLCNAAKIKQAISRQLLKDTYHPTHPEFSRYNPLAIPALDTL